MFNFFDWVREFLLQVLPNLLIDFVLWILGLVGFIVLKVINIILENIVPLFGFEDFDQLDIFASLTSTWNGLPSQVVNLCSYINIPEAFAIITTALFVRFIKDKIPFL